MRFNEWALAIASLALAADAVSRPSIENPQPSSIETGITAITGWYCPAAQITLRIDNGAPIPAPYGSPRQDTANDCGGKVDNGFSYLVNYNTLSPGQHSIQALADGVPFDTVTFNVINLGGEFLTGKAGEYWLNNFPDYGKRARVTWQQSKQNFSISATDTAIAPIDGTFYGGITTTNSGCTTPSNNGSFFEVDKFTVTFGAQSALTIVAANSGSSCTYTGTAFYTTNGGDIQVPNGNFSCSNGLQGTWSSDRILFDQVGFLANVAIKFTALETCNAAAHFGAAR